MRARPAQGSTSCKRRCTPSQTAPTGSLTLRPEGTAPICRAYVEHGMHRDPQPVKLFTIGPMYRYGAPGTGRYREHWQASVEAIGRTTLRSTPSCSSCTTRSSHRLGVTAYHLELNSIGCRDAGRPTSTTCAHGSRRTTTASTPTRVPRSRRARCASSTTTSPSPTTSARRWTRPPRSGSRSARRASRTSRPSGPTSTRPGSPTRSSRPSSAGSTTTPARPGSSSARWTTRTPRSPAAGATTASSRRSAAHRHRGSGSAQGSAAAHRDGGRGGEREPPAIDVFFALEEGAPRQDVARWLAELRAGGLLRTRTTPVAR